MRLPAYWWAYRFRIAALVGSAARDDDERLVSTEEDDGGIVTLPDRYQTVLERVDLLFE
jgi:hypothetical protein